MSESEQSTKVYRGNCHCGAFVFEVKLPEIKSALVCNCSICVKKGYMWVFTGEPLNIIKGEGSLKEYSFAPGKLVHKFCPSCGTPIMASSEAMKMCGLNARVFQDVDVWSLETSKFDGVAINGDYKAPAFTGPEPTADVEGAKIYTGSCHCGAVTVALKEKPLDENYAGTVVECNCSICQRSAFVSLYPKRDQVVVQGRDNLSYYVFGHKLCSKAFCQTCGVYILNDVNDMTDQEAAALPEQVRAWRAQVLDIRPFNLRVLNDFDLGKLKISRNDGWNNIKPAYVNP